MWAVNSFFLILTLLILSSCASGSKPCAEGGDVSWSTEIRGDRICYQKPSSDDGRYLNEGKYIQKYPSGKTAVEGEFRGGLKHGFWIQYDENGRKTVERYFENGVEKSAAK